MSRAAYSFVRHYDPAPTRELCVERHYLLCASHGALRLEADGTVWSLPPARAALITAGHPIEVTIPPVGHHGIRSGEHRLRPESAGNPVGVRPHSIGPGVVAECGQWGESDSPLSDYATTMFKALIAATWSLAEHPSPARMPAGRSPETRRALALTEQRLADDPRIDEIAAAVGLTSRSLARRFADELGLTWRAALRRQDAYRVPARIRPVRPQRVARTVPRIQKAGRSSPR